METTQNSHVVVKKEKENAVLSHKKTFNRLIKKVQSLQSQREKINYELDEALQFFYTTIHPDELILLQCLTERVHIAYDLYKNIKGFSKNELKIFKSWLTEQVDEVCSMYEQNNIPAILKAIFKELNGTEYNECSRQELEGFKTEFQKKFEELSGEKIDLSDVDFGGSQEDIMKNIFMKVRQAATHFQEKSRHAPKTKKQIEKEAKKQALEEMQAKSLNSIYKQLARALHPDLEQDSEKRILKEDLMKKLTVAHQKQDLYSLLNIEMEWMNHSVDKMQFYNDNEIKTYNAILKDQIKELEFANDMLLTHPRYMSIQRFYHNGVNGIATLQQQSNELKRLIQEVQEMVSRLKTSQAKATFKEIIQGHQSLTTENKCPCGLC